MLRHNRSWQLAAAELHIHKQTLGYRIRKIEQLTARGLTSTEHLAEWWFALGRTTCSPAGAPADPRRERRSGGHVRREGAV